VPAALPEAPTSDGALARYVVGVAITVLAVVSQYFVPQLVPATRVVYGSFVGDLFVVYGIPIVAFLFLVGLGPLRQWRARMGIAAREGLAWYGVLYLVSLGVILILAIVYTVVDPAALQLLQRANPAISQAQSDPWFYVGFSFVIGAIEETIFRGWIFGFWSTRSTPWIVPATWTSALFAAVHLYYGLTYGAASPLVYPSLFLAGFAFAAAYRYSGGNLVVPALLHGQMDATAYLQLISPIVASAIRYGVVVVGLVISVIGYLRSEAAGRAPAVPPPPGAT
jgi:membrane protease YdiL (CAAX protease family)